MVENVDDVEKHTMLLVAEYLKDTEPDIKKIDQMKHELRKRVRSEMVTVADARAVAKFAFEVMETSVKKVSTDQKRIKVTLYMITKNSYIVNSRRYKIGSAGWKYRKRCTPAN